jgi:hypothetical protein
MPSLAGAPSRPAPPRPPAPPCNVTCWPSTRVKTAPVTKTCPPRPPLARGPPLPPSPPRKVLSREASSMNGDSMTRLPALVPFSSSALPSDPSPTLTSPVIRTRESDTSLIEPPSARGAEGEGFSTSSDPSMMMGPVHSSSKDPRTYTTLSLGMCREGSVTLPDITGLATGCWDSVAIGRVAKTSTEVA